MNHVLLIFPDIESLSNFIFKNKPSYAEVNTREQTLVSVLTENDIIEAETEFHAMCLPAPLKKHVD